MPSSLSTTWALYPNSTGLPSRPLAIGRASRSCRLTTRLAPSGVVPAIRCRACSVLLAVACSRADRSLMARASRPRRRPATGSCPPASASLAALACGRRSAPDQGRLAPADPPAVSSGPQQPLLSALYVYPLGRPQHGGVFDAPRGGLGEQHPAGWGDRFHPLC